MGFLCNARAPAPYPVLSLATFAHRALAQGNATPGPATLPLAPLTPPTVQGSTDVSYPNGAKGDSVVLLDLTIEKDGTVSSAVVTEGIAPFAEHARQAVLAWRFAPARRGGTPVVARIRARVEFHQEPVPNAPSGAAPPAGQAPTSTTFPGAAPIAPPRAPRK